jgi:hypothetical protein
MRGCWTARRRRPTALLAVGEVTPAAASARIWAQAVGSSCLPAPILILWTARLMSEQKFAVRQRQQPRVWAVGILMAEHRLTEQQAFDLLRTAPQPNHVKVREIADRVVSLVQRRLGPPRNVHLAARLMRASADESMPDRIQWIGTTAIVTSTATQGAGLRRQLGMSTRLLSRASQVRILPGALRHAPASAGLPPRSGATTCRTGTGPAPVVESQVMLPGRVHSRGRHGPIPSAGGSRRTSWA